MKPGELSRHMAATYTSLRIGIAVLGVSLPLVLWAGGLVRLGLPLQESMSAYYHAGGGVMRDVFVGVLFAIGVFLFLYRGYTVLENWALNFGGACAVGVALFPMEWRTGSQPGGFSLHGAFALLFFASVAYVCVFRAWDTLFLIPDQTQVKRYKLAYRWMGIGMFALPVIAALLTYLLQPHSDARATIFFVEAAGVFVFASYWVVKSIEVASSCAEQYALEGKLSTPDVGAEYLLKQMPMAYEESPDKE